MTAGFKIEDRKEVAGSSAQICEAVGLYVDIPGEPKEGIILMLTAIASKLRKVQQI